MITNAQRHLRDEGKGGWRIAREPLRCDRYFGEIAGCTRMIPAGERYFNTNETVPDAGIHRAFRTCKRCALAPYPPVFVFGS
jgi:hypothetical protein